ncbi:hypothetical protein ACHQM5_004286 [Ranunculus cassubicifolius]
MDPFEHAKRGETDYFKGVELDVIQKSRDADGYSVLSWAVVTGHLKCCQVIFRRCPQLLYESTKYGISPLHSAAWNGRDEIIKFLLTANAKLEQEAQSSSGEEVVDYKLLMMVANDNGTALHSAAATRRGKVQCVKLLLEADPSNKLLGMVNTKRQTAMHLAVQNHNLEIVKLLVEADPDFEYSANIDGKTPLLIALEEALSGDQKAVEIRKLLIQRQPKQCKVRIGTNGWTILQHATLKGDSSAIKEIIQSCPDSSALVDNEGRNFLHLAIIFEHENIVKQILGFSSISDHIFNAQDINGDTPLHIATSKGSESMAKPLLYDHRVNKMIQNKLGKNALDAIRFEYDKRRAEVLGLIPRVDEQDLKDRSSFDLLVGALISTVSFTAGITVPGGFISDGRNKGMAILQKKGTFVAFVACNTVALALSLFAVFVHFCLKDIVDEKEINFQLKAATFCSIGSIFAMMTAFIMGSLAVLSTSLLIVLIVCGICSIFFGCAFYFLWRTRRIQRRRRYNA